MRRMDRAQATRPIGSQCEMTWMSGKASWPGPAVTAARPSRSVEQGAFRTRSGAADRALSLRSHDLSAAPPSKAMSTSPDIYVDDGGRSNNFVTIDFAFF